MNPLEHETELPDDDVVERHAREDWLAFQRDLESDWRL